MVAELGGFARTGTPLSAGELAEAFVEARGCWRAMGVGEWEGGGGRPLVTDGEASGGFSSLQGEKGELLITIPTCYEPANLTRGRCGVSWTVSLIDKSSATAQPLTRHTRRHCYSSIAPRA